ncbi:hypothetical protein OS493_040321, partial [Desmophyllum pertusum]
VQDTKVQGFVPGMKLECMDRTSLETDTYWVATVVMASGPLHSSADTMAMTMIVVETLV